MVNIGNKMFFKGYISISSAGDIERCSKAPSLYPVENVYRFYKSDDDYYAAIIGVCYADCIRIADDDLIQDLKYGALL